MLFRTAAAHATAAAPTLRSASATGCTPAQAEELLAEARRQRAAAIRRRAGQRATTDAAGCAAARQFYVLHGWKLAGELTNYRRFFDVSSLAGMRTELAPVVAADPCAHRNHDGERRDRRPARGSSRWPARSADLFQEAARAAARGPRIYRENSRERRAAHGRLADRRHRRATISWRRSIACGWTINGSMRSPRPTPISPATRSISPRWSARRSAKSSIRRFPPTWSA